MSLSEFFYTYEPPVWQGLLLLLACCMIGNLLYKLSGGSE